MTEPMNINLQKIDSSIEMIKTYVEGVDTSPVISALEAIKKDPNDHSLIKRLSDSLQPLGITKGAVLNYAPYVSVLVSVDLFDD